MQSPVIAYVRTCRDGTFRVNVGDVYFRANDRTMLGAFMRARIRYALKLTSAYAIEIRWL